MPKREWIEKGTEEYETVVALTKQLFSVCSEFEIRHVFNAMAEVVAQAMVNVKKEKREEAKANFWDIVEESMDTYEVMAKLKAEEAKKNDTSPSA